MKTSTVDVPTPDGPMPLYVAEPDGSPQAAVVVIQEAFGVNDHIEDVTRRLAGEGYLAVSPHIFHRSGGGSVDYGDFASVMPHFRALTDAKVLDDVDAALAYVAGQGIDAGHTAIVGFCFGGRVTFLVAVNRALGAASGFYGGGIVTGRSEASPGLVDRAADLKTPWLGLFGDKDAHIPVDDVERLRQELDAKAPVDHAVVRYANADHGFHCDQRESFEPESSADAWRRTLDWFKSHLG
jgi:carboxymethylenebutenolidase